QLVDAWRQIAVAANGLLGTFNVQYHLDARTPPELARPFAFSGSRSRHQLILSGEAPLVRVLERNNYRASLINWQRQRRNLLALEDVVVNNIGAEVRRLRVLAENYKIQQRAVEVAFRVEENARETVTAPVPPGQAGRASTAAADTQQLLQARSSLLQAKNQLYSIWVDYLVTRLSLYRDLELMTLDPTGVWIDDVATCQCPA